MRIAAFDIETDTSVDGRDPSRTRIVALALAVVDDGEPDRVLQTYVRHSVQVSEGTESAQLASFAELVTSLEVDLYATWNGSGFDLPMLADRAAACGVELPWVLTPSPRAGKYPPLNGHQGTYRAVIAGRPHLDVAYAYQAEAAAAGVPWSLKPVARLRGLDPVEEDRAALHELTSEALRAYVVSDAVVTAQLACGVDLSRWADPA